MEIGEMIRKDRIGMGLKVFELAKKVGVNPVYITQIEKHNKVPSLKVIKKISLIINNENIVMQHIRENHKDILDELFRKCSIWA